MMGQLDGSEASTADLSRYTLLVLSKLVSQMHVPLDTQKQGLQIYRTLFVFGKDVSGGHGCPIFY